MPSVMNVLAPTALVATISMAVLLAVEEAGSLPPLIVARLVKPGIAAASTATVNVIGLPDIPNGITVLDVQVTTCIIALHAQPMPVAEIKVRPAGRVSVMVITPFVAKLPKRLRGVRVNTPFVPTVKLPT
jgi:hypothetical protein